MRRLALLCAITFALPACQGMAQDIGPVPAKAAASQQQPAISKRKIKISRQFEYRQLEVPTGIFDTPLDVARHFVGHFPMAVEGRPLIDLKIGRESETAEQLTILLTTTGYLDDSLFGEQWRIRIDSIAEQQQWKVASAEHRNLCSRQGENKWSKDPCP